jgi:hypothetical protein
MNFVLVNGRPPSAKVSVGFVASEQAMTAMCGTSAPSSATAIGIVTDFTAAAPPL